MMTKQQSFGDSLEKIEPVASSYWSTRPGTHLGDDGAELSGTTRKGEVYSWYRSILPKIDKLSTTIHRKSLRKPGNMIVADPAVVTILKMLPEFSSCAEDQEKKFTDLRKEGVLDNRWLVYTYADGSSLHQDHESLYVCSCSDGFVAVAPDNRQKAKGEFHIDLRKHPVLESGDLEYCALLKVLS